MRLRALAGLLVAVAACAPRALPYRFASPMLGGADVPSAPLSWPESGRPDRGRPDAGRALVGHAEPGGRVRSADATSSEPAIRVVSAGGLTPVPVRTASAESAEAIAHEAHGRAVVWSRLPAPNRVAVETPLPPLQHVTDLRALVGRRDKHDGPAIALGWERQLGGAAVASGIADGPALVAWADQAGRLGGTTADAQPGDLLVFDHAEGDTAADLVAIVVERDPRGVLEMIYASGGAIRRGFVDPRRPSLHREPSGAVVNTFLRSGKRWPPKGTRYLAGELLAHVIRAR